MTDTYKTITQPVTDIIYKDKSSKFIGYLYPITTEEEVKMHLEAVKKEHFLHGIGAMPISWAKSNLSIERMTMANPAARQGYLSTGRYNPLS